MSHAGEFGICRAFCKGDGAAFVFHPDCYAPLLAAWQAGTAFFQGHDLYGSRITVKLAEIVAVAHVTPSQLAAYEEQERIDRFRHGDG